MRSAEPALGDLRLADLPEALEIERASFADPWSLGAFVAEFRNPQAGCLAARAATTAKLAGYLVYWLAGDELHVNNVAVHPRLRRAGIARRLVAEALRRGAAAGSRSAWLEVRPSNEGALALYRALGFAIAGRRRGYYASDGEDALLLARPLSPGAVPEQETT